VYYFLVYVTADNGSLYVFGANSYGQLGTGQKSNMTTPTRIAQDLGRVIDVGAVHYGHISACETHTKVYMVRELYWNLNCIVNANASSWRVVYVSL